MCSIISFFIFVDGMAWASIWINNTATTNGTFVPLSTPAISGERMYLLTGFWPTNASRQRDSKDESFVIRLYAIDSTTFAVGRLRIAWYYEIKLDGYLSAIEQHYKSCSYHSPSTDNDNNKDNDSSDDNDNVAQVSVIGNTVVAIVNYKTVTNSDAHYTISLNDTGTSYHKNCADSINNEVVVSLGSFQADELLSHFISDYIVAAVQTPVASNTELSTELLIYNKLNVCNRSPLKKINLSSILFDGSNSVKLTTNLLSIVPASNSSLYLVFGVENSKSREGHVIALDITLDLNNVTVVWSQVTPDKTPPLGQISVLNNTIIISTRNGILLYIL